MEGQTQVEVNWSVMSSQAIVTFIGEFLSQFYDGLIIKLKRAYLPSMVTCALHEVDEWQVVWSIKN